MVTNMGEVKVWEEKVKIPTYEIGEPQKNPIFLEKRVYQGSCGKVYPYPTVDTISDVKKNKVYKAVYLENEYIKVMILPELGGRIQRAYDKTNDYDFVYYNHVIKPALVGLTGPWISGGIEFNWPQHHRPTTFLPVDYLLQENEDGSKSVLLHDVDQMYGTKGITKITLYPHRAYIEIMGQLYNRTPLPQTFLWWANPAVAANEFTQSVFPPDVHAVMDHGKRDVSRFPIATGVYYKKDYSEGVDISRYKNIPVPTSYMAEKSRYDFVGGYDYSKEAGLLHVADHHISPGKKQWTWGCGDFGKAWDRNLTDEDGPYVELMTGVYTDNQPDFTWLKPYEEKTFKQYFMPYKAAGVVKNATIDAAVNMTCTQEGVEIIVYATGTHLADIELTYDGKVLMKEKKVISPTDIYKKTCVIENIKEETKLTIRVTEDGRELVSYTPEKQEIPELPKPAEAIGEPQSIQTVEELYLAGQHIEQYRHATYLPDPYYLEALKRDPGDIRTNNAYGMLLLRRGRFAQAKPYFEKAIERMTRRNPNPYNSEAYYNLGLAQLYLEEEEAAYDSFFKATWSNEQQEMAYYYLAVLDARQARFNHALDMIERSLMKNGHNVNARALKAYILRKLDRQEEAKAQIASNLELDAFDYVSRVEKILLTQDEKEQNTLHNLLRGYAENYLMIARDYALFGAYKEANTVLKAVSCKNQLIAFYQTYILHKMGGEEAAMVMATAAEGLSPDYNFPNKLEDIVVLKYAVEEFHAGMAAYALGNLYYDRLCWEEAVSLWEMAREQYPDYPTVHRNLALAYYNKLQDTQRAKEELECAYRLNPSDARVFLELDQLYKKLGAGYEERLVHFEEHREIIASRDDLYIEYITLYNMTGRYEEAFKMIMEHHFHPWEGGEGKITTQYTLALLALARKALAEQEAKQAEELLCRALVYPDNLGEGKLEGTKDNHLYYYLGEALQMQGKEAEAIECWQKAACGTDEPAGAMYYNDQPADMILYQGLAKKKLGDMAGANARFYRLLDYGEQHVRDQVKLDYFAVSLPDFLIFDEDYTKKNEAHCYYLMALANIGLENVDKAQEFLKKALVIEPSHMMSHIYEENLEKI